MSQYITKYKTENGKTRRVNEPGKEPVKKPTSGSAEEDGARTSPGADNKTTQPGSPAKQGA